METPDSSLVFYGIKITDWFQGLGALIAVIGGFWAFISLFRKDKNRAEQINSLISLSEQSKLQTRELINQVEQQRQSVTLLKEYVELVREGHELEVQNLENRKRREEKLEEQRAMDSQPNFEFFREDTYLLNNDAAIYCAFINKGKQGRLVEIKELDGNNVKVDQAEGEYIDNQKVMRLRIQPKQHGLTIPKVNTNLTLIFEDKDKRKHSQRLYGSGIYLSVERPKHLKG